METPILALTRARHGPGAGLPPATVDGRNMRLLVQLRWIAVGGQLLTILAVRFGLGVPLPLLPMLGVVAALALANHWARFLLYRRPIGQVAILLALLVDVGALSLQLSLSGGASNPFISLFLLQLVLGAILLDAGRVAILVGVTLAAYAILGASSLPLSWPPHLVAFVPMLEALGAWISFTLTAVLLAVFVTRIIRNLRARDAHVAELRQTAIEEDAILRMGLFASGAAHELGTPLASLSVILNDWSRMPRLTADPELSVELAEMQIDVARCKAIVGDILHSAGAPRGTAMARVSAENFLVETVDVWRTTHPSVSLTFHPKGLTGVSLAGEPALRQVIASLLDNAVEAASNDITLSAWRERDDLVISIADRGPGFSDLQLASVGQPYTSGKGAGRGLGLFLAATLARRLGGRLSAANRPEGGADVRLILPLLPPANPPVGAASPLET